MIVTFFDRDDRDAHADFQRWRERYHEDGYFLNHKGPGNVMLHRSACPHLLGTDWTRAEQGFGSLARNKKVCSTDRRELERWANEHAAVPLKRYRDCERL